MAQAQKGIDVLQTGSPIPIAAVFQTSAGALLGTGSCYASIAELQSDGTVKSYDFNSSTFKTTALTTGTLALTHRPTNNATVTSGIWTVTTDITGFTVGGIYLFTCTNTSASPTDQVRMRQYGSAQGDLVVDIAGTRGLLEAQTVIDGGTASKTINANSTIATVTNGITVSIDNATTVRNVNATIISATGNTSLVVAPVTVSIDNATTVRSVNATIVSATGNTAFVVAPVTVSIDNATSTRNSNLLLLNSSTPTFTTSGTNIYLHTNSQLVGNATSPTNFAAMAIDTGGRLDISKINGSSSAASAISMFDTRSIDTTTHLLKSQQPILSFIGNKIYVNYIAVGVASIMLRNSAGLYYYVPTLTFESFNFTHFFTGDYAIPFTGLTSGVSYATFPGAVIAGLYQAVFVNTPDAPTNSDYRALAICTVEWDGATLSVSADVTSINGSSSAASALAMATNDTNGNLIVASKYVYQSDGKERFLDNSTVGAVTNGGGGGTVALSSAYDVIKQGAGTTGTGTNAAFTAGALVHAPSGSTTSGSIVITPLASTVSAGEVIATDFSAYQNATQTYLFAIVDDEDDPVDLSGKLVRFTASPQTSLNTPTILHDNGTVGGMATGGTYSNAITLILNGTDTATILTLNYGIWNVTDDEVLAAGILNILPVSQLT